MFHVCPQCGNYTVKKEPVGKQGFRCPECGFLLELNRPPLFILTGASGAGKSTLAAELYLHNSDIIVMESDILWDPKYTQMQDNYRTYREMWMRVCHNISQNGIPVMLCGCALPEQFECCDHRRYFSDIYYLAVVCDDEILEKRLRMRPAWRGCDSEEYIRSAVDFNRYIKKNAETLKPAMTLLDNSHLTLKEETEFVREWIIKKTEKSENAV